VLDGPAQDRERIEREAARMVERFYAELIATTRSELHGIGARPAPRW